MIAYDSSLASSGDTDWTGGCACCGTTEVCDWPYGQIVKIITVEEPPPPQPKLFEWLGVDAGDDTGHEQSANASESEMDEPSDVAVEPDINAKPEPEGVSRRSRSVRNYRKLDAKLTAPSFQYSGSRGCEAPFQEVV